MHGESPHTKIKRLEIENEALRQHIIAGEVHSTLLEFGCDSELIAPIIFAGATVLDLGGRFVVRVRRPDGVGLSDGAGALISVEDVVGEMAISPGFCRCFSLSDSKNPWMPGRVNITDQMRISKTNPDLADTLQARAAAEIATRAAEKAVAKRMGAARHG